MAESTTVTIANIELFKRKALLWANYFNTVCLLDSNDYAQDKYATKNWLLAVDAIDEMIGKSNSPNLQMGEDFARLQQFQKSANSTIFGFLTYDLKNQLEHLQSLHDDGLQFPAIYFFNPRYIFEINGNKLTLNRNYPETFEILEVIEKMAVNETSAAILNSVITGSTTKGQYIANVNRIKEQIAAGDYYELNYCLEFKAEAAVITPPEVFARLNAKAKAPFSCFFKLGERYLMCASPERFLKKEGSKLISQPIKGTVKRGVSQQQNEQLKQQLKHDEKERAENVMIVDLVRNDLARSSQPGSVTVEELFGIYGFNMVNQMISTVTSQIETGLSFTDAIKNAFPMGSMTGAPKIEVMQNIERYENFKRGLYSGSVGYINANQDFDFNVVIRSIFYNATTKYLSLPAGSAITFDSDPEKEYEEILLKAKGMIEVLQNI